MNKKSINKFISNLMTFIILTMIFLSISVPTLATGNTDLDPDVRKILEDVLEVLLTVAGIVCVGKIIHIGILFMTSSAAEKSTAKQALLPWIIGTIVCFGAAIIGGAIIDLFRIDTPVLDY